MRPAEQLAADRCQHGIGIIVPDVEREVPVNPLERTGPDQGPGPTGPEGAVDRVERPLFQQIARAVAGRSRLRATALLPEAGDVAQPESRRLIVQLHRGDVVLHVRVVLFTLNLHIAEGILVCRLRSAQERRAILRAEARLPLVAEILAGLTDQIFGGNERTVESREVADRRAHADRVPPRRVEAHARVGEVAGQQEEPVARPPVGVASPAGPVLVDQQDRPARAAGAGGERLGPLDLVAPVDLAEGRAELRGLAGYARLRLAAPRRPGLAPFDDPLEPSGLLTLIGHRRQQDLRS